MQSTIGERILMFLKSSHVTIRELAEIIGANEHTLSNKFRGSIKVDLETLCSILEHFEQLSPDWVLLGRGSMLRGEEQQVTGNKSDADMVKLLQKLLDEEKERSGKYWETIQKLINK